MLFFSRFGYLVVVFFIVAAIIAGGISTAYHFSYELAGIIVFLFWGPACVIFGRKLDRPEKPRSALFWIPMEYWGYGIIVLGLLSAYVTWDDISPEIRKATYQAYAAGENPRTPISTSRPHLFLFA
jgi:small-conductance mechanosensitive channel